MVDGYACMLNQVNISSNNNKFYVLQLLSDNNQFYIFTRYGRVGEIGVKRLIEQTNAKSGVADFCKRFRSKTGNKWDKKDTFVRKKGKYTMIDMDSSGDSPDVTSSATIQKVVQPCTLELPLQKFLNLILSKDMFKAQMETTFKLDTRKLPLGKLSKRQLSKGMEALVALEEAVRTSQPEDILADLCSVFYTIIPHASDRGTRLPVFGDLPTIQEKKDMIAALGDIESVLNLQKQINVESVEHPTDLAYRALRCKLTRLDHASKEFKTLWTYTENTKKTGDVRGCCSGSNVKRTILEIFRVDREGSSDRYAKHKDLENRKLLWHGTNVAVVAAILKSGLRIMPHSGGRVGRGIYLASENNKSAAYVTEDYSSHTGIMFLCEVALGKEKHITSDDSSLRRAPAGFDSVVALGQTEPDPTKDTTLQLGGVEVVVPQGVPLANKRLGGLSSEFTQSEYLVYNESQVRIRYVLQMRWGS